MTKTQSNKIDKHATDSDYDEAGKANIRIGHIQARYYSESEDDTLAPSFLV